MRLYFGNYYNINDMTYPPRIRKRSFGDYMKQLKKIAMEDIAPEVANFGESTYHLGRLLAGILRNFLYGGDVPGEERLPGPSPLMTNVRTQMAAEGDNDMHWLLPWSIWRTKQIMLLLSKLMTRGPELQWETYNPTPVEARALIPRYRLGENISWNKSVYHMYNNNHGRYGTRELRDMTAKWITRNKLPTIAVAKEKSYWSKYLQELTNYVVTEGANALTTE